MRDPDVPDGRPAKALHDLLRELSTAGIKTSKGIQGLSGTLVLLLAWN